ncbi:MAG: ATP-dependent sacrificial sulfur transferase LarE [Halobacteria archaeon]|nr:ATP-dependent sacrificial sulfur transferase LarE [Halobacteria archaeon]
MSVESKIEEIVAAIRECDSVLVAFSGGVDSSTVAALAHRALGDDAVACTAVSETLPESEYEEAVEVADEIGIRHEVVSFSELDSSEFVENDSDRCYHCRTMRLGQMYSKAQELGVSTVADGTNASDRDPEAHRPGLDAVEEMEAYSPLLEHGVGKDEVREIARELGLSVWDKPSMACLSSRIPHGTEVTESRLMRVEQAEAVIREYGVRQLRVRDHDGMARVEVAPDEMEKVLNQEVMHEIDRRLREVGFDYVTLDMQGYRTGSLAPDAD